MTASYVLHRPVVASPRLASRMRLLAQFHAALTQLPEGPLNNVRNSKWLVKFCHCHDGA